MNKKQILISYILFSIGLIIYITIFSTIIHEFWHFIIAKFFWINATIHINNFFNNFLISIDNIGKLNIMWYTEFNTEEINNLSNFKIILIYLAGVFFEIIWLWLLIFIIIFLNKNKELNKIYFIFFIIYCFFTLYYNLYPMNIDWKTQNDGYNIMLILNN